MIKDTAAVLAQVIIIKDHHPTEKTHAVLLRKRVYYAPPPQMIMDNTPKRVRRGTCKICDNPDHRWKPTPECGEAMHRRWKEKEAAR